MIQNESQTVKFLDVGHGDSSVIYLYNQQSEIERVIVIDVLDSDKMLEELRKKDIKVVDLIVISHSDADHCRGINDFIEKFMLEGVIKKVCFNLDKRLPTKTMGLYLKKILELHNKHNIVLVAGQIDANNGEKKLISTSDASLSMIYPNVAETTSAYLKNSSNDASIVCLLKNAGCSVLFTGDLEVAGWRSMLKRIPNLTCDVLKMPHHGACYEEADSFGLKDILDILKPEAAIISTGQHMKYRHPAERTINLLKEERIKVYCTQFTELCHDDLQQHKRKCFGDIEVRSDDTAYEIRGEADNMKCLNHVACN